MGTLGFPADRGSAGRTKLPEGPSFDGIDVSALLKGGKAPERELFTGNCTKTCRSRRCASTDAGRR